jgi:diguanylate cyclase
MKVYTQSKAEADALFDQIEQAFTQHQVSPTPINFLVWYEYFLGQDAQLKAMLNEGIQHSGYSNVLGVKIYESLLKDKQADTSELEQAFRKFLERMISRLMDWTKGIEKHTQALDNYIHELTTRGDIDAQTLASLTNNVLATTRSIVSSQSDMQQELIVATTKIQALQKELAEARNESMTDTLTQLPNRRAFNLRVEQSMQSTKQRDQLCLILFDIDFFKKFNDTYGHLIGDAVLRFIAGVVQKVIEPSQLLARIGGEEFALLIQHASLAQAEQLAERIRIKVANSQLKRKDTGETINNIHISLGVSSYKPGETWDEWYHRTDKALYRSKENGRNRTTLSENQ